MNKKELREQIVEKHAKALLAELKDNGFDPVGIAGGLAFFNASKGHTFYVIVPDALAAPREGTGTSHFTTLKPQSFIRDIVHTMTEAWL